MQKRRSPVGEQLPKATRGSAAAAAADAPDPSAASRHLPERGGANLVTLAAIAGAHGVRGEVRLKLFTDSPANLAAHDTVLVAGTPRRLLGVGGTAKSPTARLHGISDRNAAEALRGTLIEVERDALPPLEEDEYYHADLLGLPCLDRDGTALGTVVSVENYGAGDLLEVEAETGRRSLIPFKPGIADLVEDRILLDPAFLA